MILKSFYRKKSVKIYITILSVVIVALFSINIANEYLNKVNNDYFEDVSLIYIESDKNIKENLDKYDDIKNVREVLLLEYVDTIIDKENLYIYELDYKTIVFPDKTLKDNEIIIGLSDTNYLLQKSKINNFINKSLMFKYENKDIILKIKEVRDNKRRSELIISESLFNELYNSSKLKTYVANLKAGKGEGQIIHELSEKFGIKIISLTSETESEIEGFLKIEEYIKYLSIANYLVTFILIVLIIIINKNIISDTKNNIKLEYKIGFKNYQIKLNLLKRLISLHLLNFAIALIFMFPILILVKMIFDIQINMSMFKNIFILALMIITGDLILVLTSNNKIKRSL